MDGRADLVRCGGRGRDGGHASRISTRRGRRPHAGRDESDIADNQGFCNPHAARVAVKFGLSKAGSHRRDRHTGDEKMRASGYVPRGGGDGARGARMR
ncbi:hypothetical protein Rrhod_2220 [Rhodococcus rhodnii LMG 5362]|uniref:Uncharacterized protein n=1 Tax=Rhodococcus rhodnii LMG 5362 TaxID=1273125 RepID=R7WM94_9NOCA|nr:hypothetical protein Rrhod_2220 [Rhodococcus rhodnii LMG 5362]